MAKISCSVCGKLIIIPPSKVKTKKYCSRACQVRGQVSKLWELNKNGRIVKCQTCGKEFYLPRYRLSSKRHYCSRKCRIISKKFKCSVCGKEFLRHPNQIQRARKSYCSKKCAGIGLSKETLVTCIICSGKFKKKIREIKRHPRNFCSQFCYRRWLTSSSEAKKILREANKKAREVQRKKPNIAESKFLDFCKRYSLPFRYVGGGSFFIGDLNPDFIDKENKIVVEIFGKYWHTLPNLKNYQNYDGRVEYLKKRGWFPLIFWEDRLSDEVLLHRLKPLYPILS